PMDGSTIQVFIDGLAVGTVTYNNARPDIQALFPGYANTDGAVGFRFIDTTQLADGVHTIAWVATDNQGATQGIGSRFFTVANGSSLLAETRAAASAGRSLQSSAVIARPVDPVALSPESAEKFLTADTPVREVVQGQLALLE